jgi:hypothetical protein
MIAIDFEHSDNVSYHFLDKAAYHKFMRCVDAEIVENGQVSIQHEAALLSEGFAGIVKFTGQSIRVLDFKKKIQTLI